MLIFCATQLKLWSKPNFLKVIHVNSPRGVSVHWSAGQEDGMCVCVWEEKESTVGVSVLDHWPPAIALSSVLASSMWIPLIMFNAVAGQQSWLKVPRVRMFSFISFLEFTLRNALSVRVQISLSLSFSLTHSNRAPPLFLGWGFWRGAGYFSWSRFSQAPTGLFEHDSHWALTHYQCSKSFTENLLSLIL